MSSLNYSHSYKFQRFNCESCDQFFYNIVEYNEHLSIDHFICPICNDNYKHDSELALIKHSWKKHSSTFAYYNINELVQNNSI
jgi:hypothetical protein